jgi:hypothetical protein
MNIFLKIWEFFFYCFIENIFSIPLALILYIWSLNGVPNILHVLFVHL